MQEATSQEQLLKQDFPPYRRLRAYAFDPSLSLNTDTVFINELAYKVRWEQLHPGPVGEYLEVVDYDPSSGCFYAPVNLDEAYLLAQDGLNPNEGNPRFHQQMVYAVCMVTIQNFERALGRWVLWSPRRLQPEGEEFVPRLRIYPHALREANAYYSPEKKALLFGYFPAPATRGNPQFPGGMVFTCLSHDIIAHETAHAILDGLHRRYVEPTNADCHAFHEAFADIVALFQHFTFPEVLHHQIARTRGDLASQNLLGELAQQFGQSIGHYGALRSALGHTDDAGHWHPAKADPADYQREMEPHARGAILVGAIFDAFQTIYKSRVEDLLRIATNGSGVLPVGELHPDLVRRLAAEAAKSAQHVLTMCVRALDYCPPVDITFGDYLRAIITADVDLVTDDYLHYRLAFTEAFRKRGIYPSGLRTLSADSLKWPDVRKDEAFRGLDLVAQVLRDTVDRSKYLPNRAKAYKEEKHVRIMLHDKLKESFKDTEEEVLEKFAKLSGLSLKPETGPDGTVTEPRFEVHSFRAAQRVGPNGQMLNQAIIGITQRRMVKLDGFPEFKFRGGCTLILDLNDLSLRYCIRKDIKDPRRQQYQAQYMFNSLSQGLRATYFGPEREGDSAFRLLHDL